MNQLGGLLQQSRARFTEVYADLGYFSRAHCAEIRMRGATPFIHPKKTPRIADPKRSPFNDMVRAYQADPKTWLARYHKRSRIESTFAAIKRRVGARFRSLRVAAMRVEACLKLLAWNLTRFSSTEL